MTENMERETGLEPATFSLGIRKSIDSEGDQAKFSTPSASQRVSCFNGLWRAVVIVS